MRSSQAFTLIELLLVIALMVLLITLVAPAVNSIAVGSNLTRAGQLVGDEIARARQEAVTSNREIEVRFFKLANGAAKGWVAMQIWRVDQTNNGPTTKALGKMVSLPQGVIISDPDTTKLSPLLTSEIATSGTTINLPTYGTVPYVFFRFRANGATDSAIVETTTTTTGNNFLTLQNANAVTTGSAPSNYYTIAVNPITGKVTIFRP